MTTLYADVLIIGAGLAGLSTAFQLEDRRVAVLSPGGDQGASYLASGGVACAIGEDDDPELHLGDTLEAGGELVERHPASILVHEGIDRMVELCELGVDFDRNDDGKLDLNREALHSRARIIHAAGDETGHRITSRIRRQLQLRERTWFVDGRAVELIVDEGVVRGAVYLDENAKARAIVSPATVLATGGLGDLFSHTTNPSSARGEGIWLAAEAGASLVDLEFVQFHPTAMACNERPLPLVSEAVRGAGATLIDETTTAVMDGVEQGDLAGRDVVSRTVWQHIENGGEVFLDATSIDDFDERFPSAYAACRAEGIDVAREPIPVIPAAHYHMGGVFTDGNARTTRAGLWAVGEVASTGVHGANRLASNSLLESLVFANRAADSIRRVDDDLHSIPVDATFELLDRWGETSFHESVDLEEIRDIAWHRIGIERSADGLEEAILRLDDIIDGRETDRRKRVAARVLRWIAMAALDRTESRGAHRRRDFPKTDPDQARRRFFEPRETR